jgi:hypothetical protein
MNLRLLSDGSRRGRKVSVKPRTRRSRFSLELLEDRIVPAVFNVNSTADILTPPSGTVTLRSAIEQANKTPGGNTINLTVAGTYKITLLGANEDKNATGDFDILPSGGNLTIVNTSGGAVFVDGNHHDRVFDINPAVTKTVFTVTLQGFTVENGIASPGDGAGGSGGGIRDQGQANLTLTNMVVTNNRASADGGGVAMENAVSTPWMLTINHSTISNNHAGDAGGGIDTDGFGSIVVKQGTQITGNTSVNQGAGIWLDAIAAGQVLQSANLNVNGTLVSNNKALATANFGGGIGNAGNSTVTITNSTVQDNFSGGVGGGFADENNQGNLIVRNCLFLDNVAAGNGGGIQEGGASTTIISTEVKGNSSGGVGGGILANGVKLAITSCTVADNTSSGDGGGIEVETTGTGGNSSSIITSTITGNTALNNGGTNGGGIDAAAAFTGTLSLVNDTINANTATNGGGVFWAGTAGSTFNVLNTIIAQNFADTGPDANNPAGTFTDHGGNLIGISGAGSGNTGFTNASTQTGTTGAPLDPLLGPLEDNGGPAIGAPGNTMTLETEALLPGSPAIGKGILNGAPKTDERGFAMVVNGSINVGAVSQVV